MGVRVPFTPDTWWHLRSGQYIIENRTIPTTDPFSHTKMGELWIDHGWLAQVFWYALFAFGDWAALSLAVAGMSALAFWFAWRQMAGNLFVRAFTIILGAVVSSVVWVARPQLLSVVLAAVVAYLLYRFKWHHGRLLPWIPLAMLVWVNLHGGFVIGFMLMLAYVAGEVMNNLTGYSDGPVLSWPRLMHLLTVILISLAVVAFNPHTWRMWIYPFQTVGIGALRDFIQEWRSPDFHQPITWPFVIMLMLTLAAVGRAPRRADWTDLALVGMWAAWSFFARRNIGLYGLLAAPALARYANAAWGHYLPDSAVTTSQPRRVLVWLNWLLLGLIAVAALVKIGAALDPAAVAQAEKESMPYEAVQFIQTEKPPGPMFNSYNWGGYLIFRLWPGYPVYVDGRTDLYDDAFLREYLSVHLAKDGWQALLDEREIQLVVIEANSVLAKFLRLEPGWQEVYHDQMAAVFTRNVHP